MAFSAHDAGDLAHAAALVVQQPAEPPRRCGPPLVEGDPVSAPGGWGCSGGWEAMRELGAERGWEAEGKSGRQMMVWGEQG
jgi:hypothetical protein